MKFALPCLFAALLATPALASDFQAGDLTVSQPWSRALPPVSPTGAAYMIIRNDGQQADRLLGAKTPVAGHAELHEHVHADGLMKMQQRESVEIAPGEAVSFEPGGYHVMLFQLQQPLVAGERYPMTLQFEQAGAVEIEVSVHDSASDTGNAHRSGGHHHH
jgi:periplasmic copper chaperone A